MIFRKKPEPTETEPVEQEQNPFYEAANTLVALLQNGELPEEFDLEAAVQDRAFAELVRAFEPKAAVRIYLAERRASEAENAAKEKMSEQVRQRNALPKSQRTDRAIAPAPDYMAMSKEAFSALERQYRNAAQNGRRVHI